MIYDFNIPSALKPQLQAIVLGTQKEEQLLKTVASESGLYSKLPRNYDKEEQESFLLVLLYEALLGSRRVRGTSELTLLVKGEKPKLQQCLAALRKKGKATAFTEKIRLPRYARVNTLVAKPSEFPGSLPLLTPPPCGWLRHRVVMWCGVVCTALMLQAEGERGRGMLMRGIHDDPAHCGFS